MSALRPTLRIPLQFICNQLVADGASMSARERFNMNEYPLATSYRCNETEASVILPLGNSTLVTHQSTRDG